MASTATLKSRKKMSGDALLYAVGRQGNVDELNLPAAGLEADARGRIAVDADYRTAQPHIYRGRRRDWLSEPGVGVDGAGTHRRGAARSASIVHSNPGTYPYGIYTIPEISFIGKTEEQLTDEDVPYEVGLAYYREIARGQIRGDTTGRLKLIFHRETKALLGVHIIGEGRRGADSHRPGGAHAGRHDRLLRRHGLQLPDAGGVLQGGGVQRSQQARASVTGC